MSLRISGRNMGVRRERVEPPEGATWSAFDRVTLDLLTVGEGNRPIVEGVELGKDFPVSALPPEGSDVEVAVYCTAFNTRGGGRYRLTATALVSETLAVEASYPHAVDL